jgi:hypothetical protein
MPVYIFSQKASSYRVEGRLGGLCPFSDILLFFCLTKQFHQCNNFFTMKPSEWLKYRGKEWEKAIKPLKSRIQ